MSKAPVQSWAGELGCCGQLGHQCVGSTGECIYSVVKPLLTAHFLCMSLMTHLLLFIPQPCQQSGTQQTGGVDWRNTREFILEGRASATHPFQALSLSPVRADGQTNCCCPPQVWYIACSFLFLCFCYLFSVLFVSFILFFFFFFNPAPVFPPLVLAWQIVLGLHGSGHDALIIFFSSSSWGRGVIEWISGYLVATQRLCNT